MGIHKTNDQNLLQDSEPLGGKHTQRCIYQLGLCVKEVAGVVRGIQMGQDENLTTGNQSNQNV